MKLTLSRRPAVPQARFPMDTVILREQEVLVNEDLHLLLLQSSPGQETVCLKCTATEYTIVCPLLQHAGEVVPFEHLMPYALPVRDGYDRAALQRHVCRLRRKLPSGWCIRSKRQEGYQLVIPSIPIAPSLES